MIINENWAVSTTRIETFFKEQKNILCCDDGYRYGECVIKLTPSTGNIGTITVDRTQVCFEGPEEELKEIYKKFFLRFLSAGG